MTGTTALEQLRVLRDIVSASGLTWWLDSGTLLGIVREGRLLPQDHDIDISVWQAGEDDVRRLRERLADAGYEVLLDYYQGEVFRLWLWPKVAGWRRVDLRVFRDWDGRFAWSPRTERRDYFAHWPAWWQTRARNIFRRIWLFWNYRLRGKAPRWAWPFLDVLTYTHCWWVPLHFFQRTVVLEGGWAVPEDYRGYLAYRYGNWETPVTNWQFKVDDPTYKKFRPEQLFGMARGAGQAAATQRSEQRA